MGLALELIHGQTPLDEEEKEGLLVPVSTRKELDEFEQLNIEQAIKWTLGKKFNAMQILSEDFIKLLHKKMYSDVWSWAGEFRKTEKNIGVRSCEVPVRLRTLIGDCHYWMDHATFPPDEIAIRFKHVIVSIHCFPNGNGRHSRLMADVMTEHIFKQPVFTWGNRVDLSGRGHEREQYITALKAADQGNIVPLLDFARK